MKINWKTLPELDAECKAYETRLRSETPREQHLLGMLNRLMRFGGVIEIKLMTGEHHHWGFEDSLGKLMSDLSEPIEEPAKDPVEESAKEPKKKHLP